MLLFQVFFSQMLTAASQAKVIHGSEIMIDQWPILMADVSS